MLNLTQIHDLTHTHTDTYRQTDLLYIHVLVAGTSNSIFVANFISDLTLFILNITLANVV